MSELVLLSEQEEVELSCHEAVIERGLKTFVDVGQALLAIRDARLYRAQFGTFEDYCRERWGWQRNYANKLISAAETVDRLGTIVPILPATESQVRPLTQLPPEVQPIAWQKAVETAPNGKITAAHVQAVANEFRATETPAVPVVPSWFQSSESDDWWTPQWLFDLLDDEFQFDLDVCASDANHKCDRYFTRRENGLAQSWVGCCWMNPPYGRREDGEIGEWVSKAYASAEAGATVVCLVPARTDTSWWWSYCIHGEIRFLRGRLRFDRQGGAANSATFPSAVVIFRPFLPSSRVVWWDVQEGCAG